MTQMKHLSIVDGAFLHMESAEMPMHVGSLNLFEPPAGYTGEGFYEAVKAHVAKRMHLAAVFTRKLALMPFDLANPVWIHDDDIDLDYHVRYMVLPKPGTIEQLEALAARLHSMLLDRSRPLWEFYVIEGLADGRIGFYGKVHHAAVDGQAGVAMATSLFDLTPEPRAVKPPREARANTYQLGVAELLAAALQNQVQQVVQSVKLVPGRWRRRTARRRRRSPTRRGESRRGPRRAQGREGAERASSSRRRRRSTTRSPTSAPSPPCRCRCPRSRRSARRSARRSTTSSCGCAARRCAAYLKEGRELPDKSLVAGVPISLRQEGDTTANNQVAGTLIDLGTEIADPAERLKAIKRGTAAMKKQMGTFRGVIPTDFPSLGSPWLISGLASLYGRSRIADWLRITNVTISNVPGSRVPVYLCGAKMTDYYPLSIVVHGIALNITVQSHVDQLCFGLIACRRAVPDVHELGKQLQRAMATLRALVAAPALAAPRRRRARPRTRRPSRRSPPRAKRRGARPSGTARAPRQPRLRVVAPAPCGGGRATAASAKAPGRQAAQGAARSPPRAEASAMKLARRRPGRARGAAPPLVPRPRDVPLGQAARPARPFARAPPRRRRRRCSPPTRASTTASSPPACSGACRSARAGIERQGVLPRLRRSSPASTAPRRWAGRSCSCRRCRRRSRWRCVLVAY